MGDRWKDQISCKDVIAQRVGTFHIRILGRKIKWSESANQVENCLEDEPDPILRAHRVDLNKQTKVVEGFSDVFQRV